MLDGAGGAGGTGAGGDAGGDVRDAIAAGEGGDAAPPPDRPPPDGPPADGPAAADAPPDAPIDLPVDLPADRLPDQMLPVDVVEAPLPLGNGLWGQYFDGVELELGNTGELETEREEAINFDWGAGRPHPDVDDDWFSVRWTGKVMPLYSETYTFRTVTDDGVRLWVNGMLLVNSWRPQGSTSLSNTISLQAYQLYDIRMEYFEQTGNAEARLYWSSPSQAPEIIPRARLFKP